MDLASLLAAAFSPAAGGGQFALQAGAGSAPWQGSQSHWIDPRLLGAVHPAAAAAAPAGPAAAVPANPADPAGAIPATAALVGPAPGTPGSARGVGKPGELGSVPTGSYDVVPVGEPGPGKPGELGTPVAGGVGPVASLDSVILPADAFSPIAKRGKSGLRFGRAVA